MPKHQKERLMSLLDAVANDIGAALYDAPSDNLKEVMKHLELALDLLDGEPA